MKSITVNYGGFKAEQEVNDELYDAIYCKAIDDFVKASKKLCCCEERFCINGHVLECEKCSSYTAEYSRLVELAEDLKGGKHDRV